ncbi:hypothetical protein Q1695_004008 [Nippostrongylus brasiliensis]|nr:hypothetical protein Q1695_004008 [Nippostrongylus brasiliensis]
MYKHERKCHNHANRCLLCFFCPPAYEPPPGAPIEVLTSLAGMGAIGAGPAPAYPAPPGAGPVGAGPL